MTFAARVTLPFSQGSGYLCPKGPATFLSSEGQVTLALPLREGLSLVVVKVARFG